MKIGKTGDIYPIICANDYRDRTYTIDYILSAAKTAGYNSVLLLHTMWNHEREFYVIAYIDVVKDNNDIYLYDKQRSGSSILDAGAYMGSTNPNYSGPMVSASESSDGLQSRGSWTFVSTTYQDRTYYEMSYNTYEPIFYTDMSYRDIYINNVKVDMNKSGGAGSGYIGNSLLSNKKMVGYNVPTSSAESTKTESVNEASENPVSGKPKIGNGFARIKFLRAVTDFVLIDSYNNYHSPIVDLSDTGWKDGNQTTRWQYLQDGTFESFDDSQAQTKCVFNTKMKKGSAINLCIECTTENVYAYPDFGFGLMSTMPTEWGYPSGGNRGTVLKWLYDFANTTKGTYKMSLSSISADAEFYLCFYNNSTKNIVYKVWFEGTPILVN